MAYNKKKIFARAIELLDEPIDVILEKQELIDLLPCSTSWFYASFPKDSEEMEAIEKRIARNKVKNKLRLRRRWTEDFNPTTDLALYRLCATDEERRKLATSYTESKVEATVDAKPGIVAFVGHRDGAED